MKNVGAYLRRVRAAKRLSLPQVARRSGISITSLWRVEQGHYKPSGKNLTRYAAGYGMNVEDLSRLLAGRNVQEPPPTIEEILAGIAASLAEIERCMRRIARNVSQRVNKKR